VGLDLHEIVVLAEDLLVPARRLPGLGEVARADGPRDLRVQAAREHEQPLGVLGQQLLVHPRLVVEALEIGLGDQLDEVAVAGDVADEDGQVVGALVTAVLRAPLGARARRDVELAADDRLHARLHRRLVELDRAEEVAVVGQRDGREVEVLGLLDELLELGGSVEEAVLRVDVQVDELGVVHDGSATRARWWPGACW
jgi:hypothetical protein